jgi:pantoate--beta-alanine ligase
METATRVNEVRERVRAARAAGRAVELVPTMGALHEGHAALIRRAVAAGGFTVVSLFVNPTQFGPGEDLDRYPRDLEGDWRQAAELGVDLLFAPPAEEIYPSGFQTRVEVERLSLPLEGASRPGHFRGVATVVTKLFQIVQPDRAYFGEKDFQQLRLVERLVRDLNMPVAIVPIQTVREADGLALSSRNRLLSSEERRAARAIPAAREAALQAFSAEERSAAALRRAALRPLEAEPLLRIDYVEVVDQQSLERIDRCDAPALLALAILAGRTRLIDNARLE